MWARQQQDDIDNDKNILMRVTDTEINAIMLASRAKKDSRMTMSYYQAIKTSWQTAKKTLFWKQLCADGRLTKEFMQSQNHHIYHHNASADLS